VKKCSGGFSANHLRGKMDQSAMSKNQPISDGQKWTNQRWAKMDQSAMSHRFLEKKGPVQNFFQKWLDLIFKKVFGRTLFFEKWVLEK
jgi:hypothetical protein